MAFTTFTGKEVPIKLQLHDIILAPLFVAYSKARASLKKSNPNSIGNVEQSGQLPDTPIPLFPFAAAIPEAAVPCTFTSSALLLPLKFQLSLSSGYPFPSSSKLLLPDVSTLLIARLGARSL